MFDPKNRLHFKNKSPKDKLHEIMKPSNFIKLSEEEKTFIQKCKVSRYFTSNKVMHRDMNIIYEKLFNQNTNT